MIISGIAIAKEIENELKNQLANCMRPPVLAVILVGNHPPSLTYVENKQKVCARLGIVSKRLTLPDTATTSELRDVILACNEDPTIDGILLQLPLPAHLHAPSLIAYISPDKDVDGLHPVNLGKLVASQTDGFVPCTPLGVQQMLLRSHIPTQGAHVVIVGRSQLVGRPLALLLSQKSAAGNATVTMAHTGSKDLSAICRSADILVAAAGQPHLITQDMVKEGAVVIDVGIHRLANGKLTGDVDFENVKKRCSLISPVPGGVGPMTIAMLMHNTLKSYLNKNPSSSL